MSGTVAVDPASRFYWKSYVQEIVDEIIAAPGGGASIITMASVVADTHIVLTSLHLAVSVVGTPATATRIASVRSADQTSGIVQHEWCLPIVDQGVLDIGFPEEGILIAGNNRIELAVNDGALYACATATFRRIPTSAILSTSPP